MPAMYPLSILPAALICLVFPGVATAAPELVLVAGKHSALTQLAVTDARRLFLGLPVRVNGQTARAIRNNSDELTTEIFMQRVMFMSVDGYEHQIKSLVSRTGGGRPPAYENPADLVGALQRDPQAFTYMSRDQAQAHTGLKILGEP